MTAANCIELAVQEAIILFTMGSIIGGIVTGTIVASYMARSK